MNQIRRLVEQLRTGRLAPLWQFIRFGMVGVMNTLITYVTENLGYYWLFASFSAEQEQLRVVLVTLMGFVLSVSNAYFWNSRFVFKQEGKRTFRQHASAFARTVLCYGVTGLVLSPVMKIVLVGWGVPFYLASLATLVVTIPLNFVLNKFWAFAAK